MPSQYIIMSFIEEFARMRMFMALRVLSEYSKTCYLRTVFTLLLSTMVSDFDQLGVKQENLRHNVGPLCPWTKPSTNHFSYNVALPPGFVKGKLQSGINITTRHSSKKAFACIVWAWQSLYNSQNPGLGLWSFESLLGNLYGFLG